MDFMKDERGLEVVEYVFAGALAVLFLAAIANTIFTNVKARGTGTNSELTSKIPSSPQ